MSEHAQLQSKGSRVPYKPMIRLSFQCISVIYMNMVMFDVSGFDIQMILFRGARYVNVFGLCQVVNTGWYFNALMQKRYNSIPNALVLPIICTKALDRSLIDGKGRCRYLSLLKVRNQLGKIAWYKIIIPSFNVQLRCPVTGLLIPRNSGANYCEYTHPSH